MNPDDHKELEALISSLMAKLAKKFETMAIIGENPETGQLIFYMGSPTGVIGLGELLKAKVLREMMKPSALQMRTDFDMTTDEDIQEFLNSDDE